MTQETTGNFDGRPWRKQRSRTGMRGYFDVLNADGELVGIHLTEERADLLIGVHAAHVAVLDRIAELEGLREAAEIARDDANSSSNPGRIAVAILRHANALPPLPAVPAPAEQWREQSALRLADGAVPRLSHALDEEGWLRRDIDHDDTLELHRLLRSHLRDAVEQGLAAAPPAEQPDHSPGAGSNESTLKVSTPDFMESLQGFASFCESCARIGAPDPDDLLMLAGKLRDAAFVIQQLTNLRDGKLACGWKLVPADAGPADHSPGAGNMVGWEFCPTHRHVKRGTTYQVIGEARLQANAAHRDGAPLVIYVGQNGDMWARPPGEFNDGRFVALADEKRTKEPRT